MSSLTCLCGSTRLSFGGGWVDTDFDCPLGGMEDGDDDGIFDMDEASPLDCDSDDDGLSDPEEVSLGTDPNVPDTDNDTVPDGPEVHGWTVSIGRVGSDGSTVLHEYTFTSDPLTPLSDDTVTIVKGGSGTRPGDDLDLDHISDSLEREMLAPLSDKDPEDFTEEDNETRAQYNPFIRENIPPKAEGIRVDAVAVWDTYWVGFVPVPYVSACYAVVSATVSDPAGISFVRFKVLDSGSYRTWTFSGGTTSAVLSANLDIDYLSDYQLDFKVEIKTMDTNGNVMTAKQTISSAWFGLLKDVWNAIVEFFKTVKEKALEVLDALVDWVVEKVKGMLDVVLGPVKSAIGDFISGVDMFLTLLEGSTSSSSLKGFYRFGRTDRVTVCQNDGEDEDVDAVVEEFVEFLFHSGLFQAITVLGVTLTVISAFITVSSMGLGAEIGIVLSFIVPYIITTLIGKMEGDTPQEPTQSDTATGLLSQLIDITKISAEILGVLTTIYEIFKTFIERKSREYIEIFSFIIAIIGALISLHYSDSACGVTLGLFLALFGWVLAIINVSPTDGKTTLWWVEEVTGGIDTGISLAYFNKYFYGW